MLAVMNKLSSLALTVGGIVLIVFGIKATDSLASDFSRLFSGSPTDESLWLLFGGIALLAIGSGSLACRRK